MAFHKTQYKTCTFYKRKRYKHNPKVSPFGAVALRKIKLGDAGTIGRFGHSRPMGNDNSFTWNEITARGSLIIMVPENLLRGVKQ